MSSPSPKLAPLPAWKGRQRFFKRVSPVPHEDGNGFGIKLDSKLITTPSRNKLEIPTEPLAMAVALEWDSQRLTIEPRSMPLMTLTCSTIDVTQHRRDTLIAELMLFFETDTIVFHSPEDEDSNFAKQQKLLWYPVLEWARQELGPITVQTSLMPPIQPDETKRAVEAKLHSLDNWALTATESLAYGCKSMLLPLAIVDRQITCKHAFEACRLEEEAQVEDWGMVEGGHDVDRAAILAQITAASSMLWMTKTQAPPTL